MSIEELINHLKELKETHNLEDVEIVTPVREKYPRNPYYANEHVHTGEMLINIKLIKKL